MKISRTAIWLTFTVALASSTAYAGLSDQAAMLEAWKSITGQGLARHIQVLASDEFEGRDPGSAGEDKAIAYIEAQFKAAGIAPGFQGGYLQPVPLVELRRDVEPTFAVKGGKKAEKFAFRTDYIVSAGRPVEKVTLADLPVVFVGHGVTAPEFDWDDYAKIDARGAVVILLRGDPQVPGDTVLFRGRALTKHGLGGTQYENAARHGARACIMVHTDESAGYPWSVMSGGGLGAAQNFIADTSTVPRLDASVHLNEPATRRLFASMGLDFDSLAARANRVGFAAVPTKLRASIAYSAKMRRITSHNVIAKIEGSEAKDEAIIYTGHWDHVGRNDSLPGTDKIFNGAVDNATGTSAILELARAWQSLPKKPRRTAYFVATTAEEKGLLGSEYLARHPIIPLAKTIGVLNLDALFPFSAYNAMTVTGLGSSELEDVLTTSCARIGRVLQDDGAPQAGAYYRSDHYPFAKRGVPALFAVGNPKDGDAPDDSPVGKRFAEYMTSGYHKVGDQYDAATWDMRGIEGDVRVYFETGWRVADMTRYPNWRLENEFRVMRDEMMRKPSEGGQAP